MSQAKSFLHAQKLHNDLVEAITRYQKLHGELVKVIARHHGQAAPFDRLKQIMARLNEMTDDELESDEAEVLRDEADPLWRLITEDERDHFREPA